MIKRIIPASATILATLLLSTAARALPIDNGNTLALNYSEAKTPAAKKQVAEPVLGKLHQFRYLRVTEMTEGTTNGFRNVFIKAVEPSSSMIVQFNVIKNVSLKILDTDPKTKIGDAVGVEGRLESMGLITTNTIVLNPVIIKYKDKLAPVRGHEYLYELDPNARMGTDTSGGKPKVLKAK